MERMNAQVKPVWLILLLAGFMALFVIFGGIAYAADPAIPADEALVHSLLPDYELVCGVMKGEDKMLLLMRNKEKELVCIGCVYNEDEFSWTMTESTPLPEGTILGVENFVHSLGIPSKDYYSCVDVNAFSDGTWGVTLIYPRGAGLFSLGKNWISDGVWALDGEVGDHPWSDITEIDWTALPETYTEALQQLDTTDWAVVNNPDPLTRLNLREKKDKTSGSMGKYYHGSPVRVLEMGSVWTKVEILGVRGYMMTEYLAFGDSIKQVEYKGPWLQVKGETRYLSVYDAVHEKANVQQIELDSFTGFYILSDLWEEWYHVWFYDLDMGGYVRQSDLWPGNG